MSSTMKILLGALATAILAWFLYGLMGLGAKCAAGAATVSPPVAMPAVAPGEPEAPATAEAVKNCQADVDTVIAGKTINFTSGGATIAPESLVLIESLAKALKACAGTQVEVSGHTDVTGGDAKNQTLSEARANSVVQSLVERGIPTDRLLPKGYGETAPLDPALSDAAHAKNRRIEFKVAASGAAAAPAAPAAQ
jgi:OmpA-OmpF porin, OOP family